MWQKCGEMMDARFQEGNSGLYLGGAGTSGPWPAALGEIGGFSMPNSWSTFRLGALGLDNGGTGVAGGIAGGRIHAPTRLTPYVGVSSVLGFTGLHSGIASHNSRSARQGQKISTVSGLFAFAPEAGLSYWITSSVRINAGASYYITDGGKPDFLLYQITMDFSTRDPMLPPCDPPGLDYSQFPEPPDIETPLPIVVDRVIDPILPQSDAEEEISRILKEIGSAPSQGGSNSTLLPVPNAIETDPDLDRLSR